MWKFLCILFIGLVAISSTELQIDIKSNHDFLQVSADQEEVELYSVAERKEEKRTISPSRNLPLKPIHLPKKYHSIEILITLLQTPPNLILGPPLRLV